MKVKTFFFFSLLQCGLTFNQVSRRRRRHKCFLFIHFSDELNFDGLAIKQEASWVGFIHRETILMCFWFGTQFAIALRVKWARANSLAHNRKMHFCAAKCHSISDAIKTNRSVPRIARLMSCNNGLGRSTPGNVNVSIGGETKSDFKYFLMVFWSSFCDQIYIFNSTRFFFGFFSLLFDFFALSFLHLARAKNANFELEKDFFHYFQIKFVSINFWCRTKRKTNDGFRLRSNWPIRHLTIS